MLDKPPQLVIEIQPPKHRCPDSYLDNFIDAQSSVQLCQLILIFGTQELHELFQKDFLIVSTLWSGGRVQELIQRRGDALAAGASNANKGET